MLNNNNLLIAFCNTDSPEMCNVYNNIYRGCYTYIYYMCVQCAFSNANATKKKNPQTNKQNAFTNIKSLML